MAKPQVPGLIKGLGVTLNTMVQTIKPKKLGGGAATVQYPHEKETPTLRARGVIALREENCTSCMLCVRSCPDWCIYIGICVEVCPFEAIFWSPEYEYSEPRIADLLHDRTKLGEWMETVPEPPALEVGAEKKKGK